MLRLLASNHFRNPHFTDEKNQIVWFCGNKSIGKVNIGDMNFKEIKNVLPSEGKGKDAVPMRALLKESGNELFLLYVFKDTFHCSYINELTSEVSVFPTKSKFAKCILI